MVSPKHEGVAMQRGKTTLERAFEMARSGRFKDVPSLKIAISREGYAASQISGRILLKQLRDAIQGARQSTDA